MLFELQSGAMHSNERSERAAEHFRAKLRDKSEACTRLEQQHMSDLQTISELRIKLENETRRAKSEEDENIEYRHKLEDWASKGARLDQQKLMLQQRVDEYQRLLGDTEASQNSSKIKKANLKQTVKQLEAAVANCSEENKGLRYALEAREVDKREFNRQLEDIRTKLSQEQDEK